MKKDDTTKPLTKKAIAEQEKQEAIKWLKENIKQGSIIYTVLKSVSRSGMFRKIHLLAVIDGDIQNLNWYYLKATGQSIGKTYESRNRWEDGVGVSGCGMDMGYHLVSNLAYILTDGKDYKILRHRWL